MEHTYTDKTPRELADDLMKKTGLFENQSEEMMRILTGKPFKWSALRDTVSSDKQADREWEKTTDGNREIALKYEMRSLEKQISALKIGLRLKDQEARNMS